MADAPKILGSDTLRIAYPKINLAIGNSNEALSKATEAELDAATAKSEAERVSTELGQAILAGDSSPLAGQLSVGGDGTVYPSAQERFVDEREVVITQLDGKADKFTNTFNKYTYGTFDDASVLSAIANNPNPRAQVLGITSSKELSKYSDRDSVAFYSSNRSTKPTVVVNSGTITYSDLSVQVTGVTVSNLDKLKEGMIIDTLHTPNRWTSFIDRVDIDNQVIYVKDGWYQVKAGGSTTPSLPPNNIGFDVNRITKVWVQNTNVFLYPEDTANSGVASEVGIFNNKPNTTLGGYDFVHFGPEASSFGIQIRKAAGAQGEFYDGLRINGLSRAILAQGLKDAALRVQNSKAGLIYEGNSANDASAVLVTDEEGRIVYEVSGIGRVKSLSYQQKTWGDITITVDFKQAYFHILTAAANSTYIVISPTSMTGRSIKVMSLQNVNLRILGSGNFVKSSGDNSTLSLSSKVAVELYSDGSDWYVL